jgi:hypothetical protein
MLAPRVHGLGIARRSLSRAAVVVVCVSLVSSCGGEEEPPTSSEKGRPSTTAASERAPKVSFEDRCMRRWNRASNRDSREILNGSALTSPYAQPDPGQLPTSEEVGVAVVRYDGPAVEDAGVGSSQVTVRPGDCLVVGFGNTLFAEANSGFAQAYAHPLAGPFAEFAQGPEGYENAVLFTQPGLAPTTTRVGKLAPILDPP